MIAAPPARRIAAVLGTAGHVDHGKTSVVRALTGMETDRLPEEQARGISIELGFAWLDRPAGRIAFIDVPGHERFVRQMVAGATGIDAVLLVVAADEGVMPQTREHLDICGLLGIRKGLVVLSRVDLADPDFVALAREDVLALVSGTFLEGAPIVPFSIHDAAASERLTAAIDTMVATSARDDESDRPFLLAIDRAFSRPGFGTIVTGTSRSGVVAVGDELVVHHPQLPITNVRVRGLELHGEPVERAAAGQRVAVNLSGVAASDLPRGARLCHAGLAEPQPWSMWDVRFGALARLPLELPDGEKGLACFGSTVVEASLGMIDRSAIAPGESAWLQLRLAEPLALLPGERWIFRGFRDFEAGTATLGGGRVLAPSRRRRKRSSGANELEAIGAADVARSVSAWVAAAGEDGTPWARLHAALPWPRAQLDVAVSAAPFIRTTADRAAILVSPEALGPLAAALVQELESAHRAHPSGPGLMLDELRTRVRPGADPVVFHALVEHLVAAGRLGRNGAAITRAGFAPKTSTHEDALDQQLLAHLTAAALSPPRVDELGAALPEPRPGKPAIDAAIVRLVAAHKAVRVQKDVAFATSALAVLEARVRDYFTRAEWLDAQALKDLTGVSRKWTIPLGEWLDRARVTVRVGDRRRLRS